jgi:hypothetical protein
MSAASFKFRIVTVASSLAILIPVALVTAGSQNAAAAGSAPGFATPVEIPGASGTEPTLAIDNSGKRYVSWQVPGAVSSTLDGKKFATAQTLQPSGGGDVTLAVDAAGAAYDVQFCGSQQELHACLWKSTDGGKTWTQTATIADQNEPIDRPWIDVYPKHAKGKWDPAKTTVYLEYHTLGPDDLIYTTVSNDGGTTFSTPTVMSTNPNTVSASACNTIPGGVRVDQRNGNAYALWIAGNDAPSNAGTGCNYSQIGPFDRAFVARTKDKGATWKTHQAWQGQFDETTRVGDNADKIFATIDIDQAGEIYVGMGVRHHDDPAGFVAQCESNAGTCSETPQQTDLEIVASPFHGAHWTPPFIASKQKGSYFFPYLAAGSRGIVDAFYYYSSTMKPNDPKSVWYPQLSRITNAAAKLVKSGGKTKAVWVGKPQVTQVRVGSSANHVGGICTFGIFCSAIPNANRNLADIEEVHLDPSGAANIVYTDDNDKAAHINFACQISGPSAYKGHPAIKGCYKAH